MIARCLPALAGASLLALAAGPAIAQDEAPAPASAGTPAAEPAAPDIIVVTARRREEDLQDVPVAVAVFGGDTLETTGTYNVNRLTQLQPSLNFYSSNPRNSNANIRGLGAPFGLTNDGIEQGVGLYIDQVYYSRAAASTFDFNDTERIEVLRGPQGTLYGKNTTAGAINLTSRAPSFDTEGRYEMSAGNLGFVQARGSISGPLVDDLLAARIAFSGTRRRGTLFHADTGNYVNEQDNLGFRGSLLWRASDVLDVTLSGDFNRQNPECCAQVWVRVAPTLRPANRQYPFLADALGYAPPSTDPYDRLIDPHTELQARQEFGGASLRAEWELGAGLLTSVTAYRFWDWQPSNDRDFIGLPITTISANPSRQHQYTQEIRYASDWDGPINFVAGVFGYRQTIRSTGIQEQGAAASLWLLGPTSGSDPALLDGLRQETDISFSNNSLAAFGQLSWEIADGLTVTPGLRLNFDSKHADYNAVVSGGLQTTDPALIALQRSILSPQAYVADFSDTNVSGDITLSWQALDDLLLYGTYARAFKSGGVNLSGIPNNAAGQPALEVATVRPESVDHFELGLKSQWLDRALTLNVSAFHTEIRDYQATVVNAQVGVLRGFLANVEKVRVRGIEVELSADPTDNLHLYASGAWTDAEYASFPDAPCPVELTGGPASCDISGSDLPGVSGMGGVVRGRI